MTTDNPKISGYVPQEIFDCLLEFKEKRSLKSVSLALTVALSEYFGVDQKVDRQSSLLLTNNFVSKDRFEALENKLSELSSSLLSELDKLVEQKFSSLRSEILSSSLKSIEVQTVSVESEPQEDSNHLQLDLIDSASTKEDLDMKSQTSLSITEQSSFALSESFISLSGKFLAKRINIGAPMLSSKKKELSEQNFYNWLQDKDPDKISWQPVGGALKGHSKGWTPAENTSSELLSRLNEWLAANPE